MNCQEALSLLYDVIDKEASQIDIKEVQKHLDCCQDCLKRFQVEESLQEIVKERLKAVSDIPKIDQLKAKVLSRLEEVDLDQSNSQERKVSLRMPAIALAAAASLALLGGAAFWGNGLFKHYVEYIPIEKAHWAAEADKDGYNDAAATQALMTGVAKDYEVAIANSIDGLSLVGARTEEIMGYQVPHFKYASGDDVVSAFVFPANSFELPEDLMETKVEIDGVCHLSHNCRGCWLVYYKQGDALIVTATTNHSFRLLEFKPVNATGAI